MSETKSDSFKMRVWSALVLGPAVLVILYIGGDIFTLMLAAAGAVSVHEWGRMILTGKQHPKLLLPLAAGLTAVGIAASGLVYNPLSMVWMLLGFCCLVLAYNLAHNGPQIRRVIFGILYIGFAMEVMVWIRNGEFGLYNILTLLFIVWASDICAYLSGKAIGGPKLAPTISPKKTWAGFIGSSVGAGAISAFLASQWVLSRYDALPIGDMGPQGYFIMGFVLAMFGQAGDLFISIFKRHYGIKDTGALIPGHGGLLDRIDALLLVTLVFGSLVTLLK